MNPTDAPAGVKVTSEIGALERVICHTPGPELQAVTPDNRRDYLFNDLLDLELARREHRRFVAILERFADVLQLADLLEDVLGIPEARDHLLGRAGDGLPRGAREMESAELARLFVEGEESSAGGSLARLVNEKGYVLPPLPNLFFPRDPVAVVGERITVASMQHAVRWTEVLIASALFRFHPLLESAGCLYDGTRERRLNTSLEGGDVHVLRRDLLLMGMSERTSAAGIDALREAAFGTGEIRDLLVVILPAHRTSIHLDMIFTMIDREMCCVFAPYFVGPTRLPVLHLSRGREGIVEVEDLFTALEHVDLPLEPVFCGGERRLTQEREQWASACNLLSLAPGLLVAYDRNENTLEALRSEAGFRLVAAGDLLAGGRGPETEGRTVVTFRGSELVRGGGGPRCMTLPVRRAEAW